jgi:hypothetical protein
VKRALSLAALASALAACNGPEASLHVVFPPDGGACEAQTSLACVNYLQFTVGVGSGFSSDCLKVDVALDNLCDVEKLARGQQLFKLPPETRLPITLEGLRVFPATSCSADEGCMPRRIFSGTTQASGKVGDFAGRDLPLEITLEEPCGRPEQFFFLPPGSTCEELCGSPSLVVCSGVQGGCLCQSP